MDEDGTSRRTVFSFTLGKKYIYTCVALHREYLYAISSYYTESMDSVGSIVAFNLKSGKMETLYNLPENVEASSIKLFADALYFIQDSYTLRISLKNATHQAERVMQAPDGNMGGDVTFWDNTAYTQIARTAATNERHIYTEDLTSGQVSVSTDVVPLSMFTSDGTYLYRLFVNNDGSYQLTISTTQNILVDSLTIKDLFVPFPQLLVTESDHVFLAGFNTPAYYFPKYEIGTGNITLKPLFPTE